MPAVVSLQNSDLNSQWKTVQALLRDSLGDDVFSSWIAPLEAKRLDGNRLEILAPSRFTCDWIKSHYQHHIQEMAEKVINQVKWLDITFDPHSSLSTRGTRNEHVANKEQNSPSSTQSSLYNSSDRIPSRSSSQAPLQAHLDPKYVFENFVVGKSNELAYAAAMRVAESDKPAFNPLFLYGGVGLGKTHLMHAIAWRIKQQHPTRRVIYLSAEKFMYQFICAIRQKNMVAFKEQFRNVDVLMIDDVQFISGKDSTQEEFFHTFNALVDQNKQIILSADKSPSDLDGMEERLRSRLGWGLVADIHPTTYELRLGILQSKIESLQIRVPEKVLEFLAHKITSNVRELEGALKRIAAHSSLVGREITLDLTQEALRDLLRANNRRISIDDIKKKVMEKYSVKLSELEGARRQRCIARPRQIAMYLCKNLTTKSLPEIGRAFGGRDHTTIIHAVRTIEKLIINDTNIAEDIDLLTKTLGT